MRGLCPVVGMSSEFQYSESLCKHIALPLVTHVPVKTISNVACKLIKAI